MIIRKWFFRFDIAILSIKLYYLAYIIFWLAFKTILIKF